MPKAEAKASANPMARLLEVVKANPSLMAEPFWLEWWDERGTYRVMVPAGHLVPHLRWAVSSMVGVLGARLLTLGGRALHEVKVESEEDTGRALDIL